jgi:hypothetical protein
MVNDVTRAILLYYICKSAGHGPHNVQTYETRRSRGPFRPIGRRVRAGGRLSPAVDAELEVRLGGGLTGNPGGYVIDIGSTR